MFLATLRVRRGASIYITPRGLLIVITILVGLLCPMKPHKPFHFVIIHIDIIYWNYIKNKPIIVNRAYLTTLCIIIFHVVSFKEGAARRLRVSKRY